ncbi:MAG: hypothetical protein GC149_19770 [Gammaproteobacteria bacterium]|nr:hypothetical protein [Gammaproteobacteria bacterium]
MVNTPNQTTRTGLSWITLFASTGTLLCCALPIILVSLGLGATVAAVTSYIPVLITLSHYKVWIFLSSGSLLVATAWLMWRNRGQCPVDPELAGLCQRARLLNRRIWLFATVIWLTGFTAAYLALPIQQWLES